MSFPPRSTSRSHGSYRTSHKRAALAEEVKRSSVLRSVLTQKNGWDMRMPEYEALHASLRAPEA